MELVSTFRERLESSLKERKMSARELAYKSNINEGTISRYLSGKNEPKIYYLHLISNALHVSPVWLMGYDTTKEPNYIKDKIVYKLDKMSESQLKQLNTFIDTFILNNDET